MKYKKSSLGILGTKLLLQRCSAVRLDSNLTPCAEQALAQIDSAVTLNTHCLCYQYATPNHAILDVFPFDAADPTTPKTEIKELNFAIAFDPADTVANITDKGGLVTAIDGKCADQTYVIKGRVADTRADPDLTGSCTVDGNIAVTSATNYIGCCGKSAGPLPADLCQTANGWVAVLLPQYLPDACQAGFDTYWVC